MPITALLDTPRRQDTNHYMLEPFEAKMKAIILILAHFIVAGTSFSSLPVDIVYRVKTKCWAKIEAQTPEQKERNMEKATKAMTAFTNKYLKNTCTSLCADKSVPAVVIRGLAEHKVTLGAPLCPCRFYEDKEAEAKDGYWNCPCVPMRERHECHCMLFLTEDNAFAGPEQVSVSAEIRLIQNKQMR